MAVREGARVTFIAKEGALVVLGGRLGMIVIVGDGAAVPLVGASV